MRARQICGASNLAPVKSGRRRIAGASNRLGVKSRGRQIGRRSSAPALKRLGVKSAPIGAEDGVWALGEAQRRSRSDRWGAKCAREARKTAPGALLERMRLPWDGKEPQGASTGRKSAVLKGLSAQSRFPPGVTRFLSRNRADPVTKRGSPVTKRGHVTHHL